MLAFLFVLVSGGTLPSVPGYPGTALGPAPTLAPASTPAPASVGAGLGPLELAR